MSDTFAGRYNEEFFYHFTDVVKHNYPDFDSNMFHSLIYDEHWEQKQFKERIRHISTSLRMTLPNSYRDAISILIQIAPQCCGVEYLFFPDFVEVNGLDDWTTSITALERFTSFSSSEFAVRPFILKDSQRMMDQMLKWASHPEPHIRRLASEGCRPRLPWATALNIFKADPMPIVHILEQLKRDTSAYVQKSVANNLNDISKDNPELVKKLARDWYGENPNTDWIIKHGCRSLLRKSDPDMLYLFGFENSPDVTVSNFSLDKETLKIGQTLNFSFSIRANTSVSQKLRVEYAIDFVKANRRTTRKQFKIAERNYDKEDWQYVRSHHFKDLTVRKHYPGKHQLSIIVNGKELATTNFYVTEITES
ncbi:DNA alkylation repair protein [Lysinibacillus agricola]|uniref:DNA alkylation repair protein n=1 Tax=Lysinibacillus agricola TaxID=2590012 RepID=A0ABX7AVZ5_9BACI|nr:MULTISPECIES: DNA alkylation repair protein [Lysinibacillus]KOS62960.1 DNA alkylation repair protein [Lysinibacillus sp. FJAT-14222]QQP13930.1 DNA alkylation repair protein [Lysinibacillus agricola]